MLPRETKNASLALVATAVCHAGPRIGSGGLVIAPRPHADVTKPLTTKISSKQAPKPQGNSVSLFLKNHLDLPRRSVRGRRSQTQPGLGVQEWFAFLGTYSPKKRDENKERKAKYKSPKCVNLVFPNH